ncbi:MAG: UbiD family decarboxylase [Chloroflexi bacterium]|nr:UbiD family decarboxylase [Chloroflexota bacterium]
MGQDLRSFLDTVQARHPDQLLRIRAPVQPVYDATALVLAAEQLATCPILSFDHVVGSEFPLVANVLATRARLALAMGVSEPALQDEYARRSRTYLPARRCEDSPLHERVAIGEAVDLRGLPILTHFEQDGGPYLSGSLVVARDPHSEVQTIGYHRMMLKGPRKLGLSLHSRRRMFEYFRRAEELGRPLEAAVVLGAHPLVSMAAISYPPMEVDKFEVAGGLFGEPLEVVRCRTIDLLVPRWAEIVIEGRILNGVREREGPFGEFTGYASSRGTENVFEVTALLHREGAIYQDVNPGLSVEHCFFLAFPREVLIADLLRRTIPNLRAVRVPTVSGCGSFHCYISMKKTIEGQPRQAILTALGADHYIKHVIVVDEDIDVANEQEVLWAVATRVQADRDVFMIPETMGTLLDPTSPRAMTCKMGIDATRPLGDFPPRLTLPRDALERARALLNGSLAPSNA